MFEDIHLDALFSLCMLIVIFIMAIIIFFNEMDD